MRVSRAIICGVSYPPGEPDEHLVSAQDVVTAMVKPRRSAGYFLDSFGSVWFIVLTPALFFIDVVTLSIGAIGLVLAGVWWGPNMKITDVHVVTRHYYRPIGRRVRISDVASVHAVLDPKAQWEGTGRGLGASHLCLPPASECR